MSDFAFEATRWSLIQDVRAEDRTTREKALEELCKIYWKPLYNWLRRSGRSHEDASDIVQGFFALVIEKGHLERADPKRGKLRTWMLTILRSHANDLLRRERTHKRGGKEITIPIDALENGDQLLVDQTGDADEGFDRDWAMSVYDRSMERLRTAYERTENHRKHFECLSPCIASGENGDLQALADELDISYGAVRVALHRLRARFRKIIREEIAETILPGDEIETELHYLAGLISE